MFRSTVLLALVALNSAQILDTLVDIFGESRPQSVHVTGKLLCNGEPMEKAKVKLYEDELVLDVLLMEQYTNDTGLVDVFGTKSERSWIEPKVNIYHKCNYDGSCYRKISVAVPPEFIELGSESKTKVFDFGEINLAAKYAGESEDCYN